MKPRCEQVTCVDCQGRGWRHDGSGGRTKCTECDGSGLVIHVNEGPTAAGLGRPLCPSCGDYAIDGKVTCGRAECGSSTGQDR